MWRWCDEMSNSVLKTTARNAFFVLHCVLLRNFVGLKRHTVEILYHINRKPPTVDMKLRNQSISPTYCIYTFVRPVKPMGVFPTVRRCRVMGLIATTAHACGCTNPNGPVKRPTRGDGTAKPHAFGAPVRFDRRFELCV
jgi:hypothetical protein